MDVIIYDDGGAVRVITPAPGQWPALADLAAVAVPAGADWRIVDTIELPDPATAARWQWTATGPLTLAAEVQAVPPVISFPQMLHGLVAETWITPAEGAAWLDGTLPTAVLALIATLPSEAQFLATARAKRPSEVRRDDSLLNALATAQGKTAAQLDQFFITYAGV